MKHLLLTTIAAVVLVGCGESQQSAPAPETKPAEPIVEATQPEPPTAKAPDISIHDAAKKGRIKAVKQHLAAGTDVNAKDKWDMTPLHQAAARGHKEVVELLIAKGADVNATDEVGRTPLHFAASRGHKEIAELLIAKSADVNAKVVSGPKQGLTPLDAANESNHPETADLLRKHGGKTSEELKAEAK
jgi:ankyrin repeat protein